MNHIKARLAIACEYVAMGANGKHTLVNVYSGDIVVKAFPARILIAFMIELEADFVEKKELIIEVFNNKRVVAKAVAEFKFDDKRIGLINLPQLAMQLDGPTDLRVVVSGEGVRTATLLRKKISVGLVPN